jgi:hypothetical protein
LGGFFGGGGERLNAIPASFFGEIEAGIRLTQ